MQRNARRWNCTGVGYGPRHYSADQEVTKTVAKNVNGFIVVDGFHLTSNVPTREKYRANLFTESKHLSLGETMWPSEKRRRRGSSYRFEGSTGLPKYLDYRTINPGGGF